MTVQRQIREIMAWWCLSESRVENIVPLIGACQEDQTLGRQFFPVMSIHQPAKEYMDGLIRGGIFDMDRKEPLRAIVRLPPVAPLYIFAYHIFNRS